MNNKNKSTEHRRSNIGNRISGGIAVLLGLAILITLVIENRWGYHDNLKPLKALAGSIMFILVGFWYIRKGANTEPWLKMGNSKDNLKLNLRTETQSTLDKIADEELRTNVAFQKEHKEAEKKYRDLAQKLESQFIIDDQNGNKKDN